MSLIKHAIHKVIVHGDSHRDAGAKVLSRLPAAVEMRVEPEEGSGETNGFHPELRAGKQTLRLLSNYGSFLKPCPGTRNYICCGYQILNIGTNCPMDCSYCILQSYFQDSDIRIFVNLEEHLPLILEKIDSNPDRVYRVGTGEFTDSLALDHLTGWTETLIPAFSTRKNAILELKTKTDNINGILKSPSRDRIVVSWSLNSSFVADFEEKGAPPLRARLEAAGACQKEGFAVGFHFDPLVAHRGWRDDYRKTVDMLEDMIDPLRVIWVSLGALRFMPALKAVIRERHPETGILDGEFVPGLDGKMRYFKPLRVQIFKAIAERLKAWHGDLGLYLCMESDEVWSDSLGWSPGSTEGLRAYLDGRVEKFFG